MPSDIDFQRAVTKLQIISSRSILLFSVLPFRLHIFSGFRLMFSVFFLFLSIAFFSVPSKHGLFFQMHSSGELGLDQNTPCWSVGQLQLSINMSERVHLGWVWHTDQSWSLISLTGSENVSFFSSGTENTSVPANRLARIRGGCFLATMALCLTLRRRRDGNGVETADKLFLLCMSDNHRLGDGQRRAMLGCL